MDLTELETFIAIVELGSFSLAATRMHVSQPSVTARVQRLEERLSTQLLRRTTRRVEATKEGQRLYDAATQALHGLKQLVREFDGAAARSGQRIVVAATPMIAATALPPLIHAYKKRFPDVRIKLLDLLYRDVIDQIETGAADLGVVAFDGDSAKLRFQPLAEEELLLVVPQGHPLAAAGAVTLEQVMGFPLLILDRYTSLIGSIGEECRQRNLAFPSLSEASNLNTLLGMLDAGNGITFLPSSMAQINARRERVSLHVTDVRLTRQYGIVLQKKGGLSGAALNFVRYLQQEYANSLAAKTPAAGA
ncbi:Morphology and auto-aggregation control protein [Variovorax sp. PBL-H6]|nr:Morphology and auto-aggregation control protein [Variovorax sp. PBL-H6]